MTDLWVKYWFEFKLDMKANAWSSFVRQFLPWLYFKYLLIFLVFWIYFRNICERRLFISAWWTMVEVLLLLIAQSLQSGCLPHRCRHVCQNQCCHTCHCLYIPRINHCELHCSNSYWGNQSSFFVISKTRRNKHACLLTSKQPAALINTCVADCIVIWQKST